MVYGEPVLTTRLVALELCAANFYTQEMFGKIKIEIEGVVALDIINEENISTTVVLKVKECDKGQHIYTVLYERNTENMECECSRWSSKGIPYRHMFCAMKRVVAATWMVFLGAQDGPSFHDTMNEVSRLTQTLEQKSCLKRRTRDSPMPNFVSDPSIVKEILLK
ncbi:hypothetical protein AHAS_Ahas09G0109100 [Arachis hypogaea]